MLTLTVQNAAILKKAQNKIYNQKCLTSKERDVLGNFLTSLPSCETLLNEKFPLSEEFEIKIFDIEAIWPQLQKWIALFKNLPKNGNTHYPNAGWIDAEEDKDFWRRNVIIKVAFVPSFQYSKKDEDENKIIGLNLKTDGTAQFEFWMIEDAENFPDLYNFNGSWKEAYLLTVKTLQQGWPQTKFPKEFEQFLKK
ncbi:hypothetical protein [Mucilaginibacter frigoritolerans]|nr:hypothetical protein [Mucilaginibacter frigoritolerans]